MPQHHVMSRREVKKVLKELKKVRGRHTELVSLYIPAGYNLNEIVNFLTGERSEAENIKSKQTKKNVQAALDKIQRRLRDIKSLPEHGVALFAGNAAEIEGKTDLQMWEVVPPSEIEVRIYRCDKGFVLDPLADMVEDEKVYALISVDRNDAAIALLRGKILEILQVFESNVPGKQKAGGQSQQRYARIREGLFDTYMKDIASSMKNFFLEMIREKKLSGIILGGSGHTREDLFENYLSEEIKKVVAASESTNYAGEDGIHELLNKVPEIIDELDLTFESNLVNKFLENLKKDNGLSVYGMERTLKALEMGAVDKLLVSEKLTGNKIVYICEDCNKEVESDKIEEKNCGSCGNRMALKEDETLIEDLEEKSHAMGTEFHLISIETQEGRQFRSLGGIGGILRFRI